MEAHLERSAQDTILIIDDDAINRGILGAIFSSLYVVEEAENGKEGLELLFAHRDRLCAVLLDYVMPELDGLAVLRIL